MDKEKRDFVLRRGVFGMGLPVAFLMSVTMAFQVPGSLFKFQAFQMQTFLVSFILFAPIFLVAGFFWGLFVYKFASRRK